MQHPTHPFDQAAIEPLLTLPGERTVSSLAMRWQSLDEAGRVVASLAGKPEPQPDDGFVARVERTAGGCRRAAEQRLEDLAAMMEPGLAALLYVCENGGDARAPAIALWREYSEARSLLLALA